jgi:hypothetical protein
MCRMSITHGLYIAKNYINFAQVIKEGKRVTVEIQTRENLWLYSKFKLFPVTNVEKITILFPVTDICDCLSLTSD